MESQSSGSDDRVVRVSLLWLLAGVLLMVGLGMLGGVLAGQLWPPQVFPLTDSRSPLVTTTQQVTISPSMADAELLRSHQRSVLLLARGDDLAPVAIGVVLTNDGLVVAPAAVAATGLVGIDHEGRQVALDSLGSDALFGLAWWRVRDGVLQPLDIRSDSLPVAQRLLAVSRSPESWQTRAHDFRVAEYVTSPAFGGGVQQVMRDDQFSDGVQAGAVLLDEEGQLAGLVVDPTQGLALGAPRVRDSLQRMIEGQREYDPFIEMGLAVRWRYALVGSEPMQRFVGEVVNVRGQSAAARATLRRGDMIVRIGDTELTAEQSVLPLLVATRSYTMTVWRNQREVAVTVSAEVE